MSRWARLLSADYREAVAAEAAGDLERAATAFLRAGDAQRVVELRRRLADAADDPGERIRHLRAARSVADDGVDRASRLALERALGTALAAVGEPGALAEAVTRFEAAGDTLGAAETLLALGREDEARATLARGRHFERLEALDRETARREAEDAAEDDVVRRARAATRAGDRAGALSILGSAGGAAAVLRREIEGARPEGRLALAAAGTGAAVTVVGALPVVLGRAPESALPLSDPGISRHHARLDRDGDGFRLADLGSRNGTWIDGLPVGDGFALPPRGRFEMGERCRVTFRAVGEAALCLEIEEGLAAGARALVLAGPADLSEVLPVPPSLRLDVASGWLRLSGDGLTLGGAPVPGPVDLLVDDRVGAGDAILEVRRR